MTSYFLKSEQIEAIPQEAGNVCTEKLMDGTYHTLYEYRTNHYVRVHGRTLSVKNGYEEVDYSLSGTLLQCSCEGGKISIVGLDNGNLYSFETGAIKIYEHGLTSLLPMEGFTLI